MSTLRKSSSSVKVFYPEFNREGVIKEISRCVKECAHELGLRKVILFGSYARGDYTAASDIDLLVVYDEEESSNNEIYKTLRRGIKLPRVELHMLSKKDYEVARSSKWIKTIEEEGVKILNEY